MHSRSHHGEWIAFLVVVAPFSWPYHAIPQWFILFIFSCFAGPAFAAAQKKMNGLKGKFNHWPKTQMKVTKNFSFQFRMSDSGGNDFWVTHFSRIQASLSKMFNLENDRRKVIQRRRAAKKSWELSLGSLIVCSTGCATTKTCVNVSMRWRAVEFLTFCVDFALLCREARFAVEKQGRHPIPVLSLIGVKRSCQSPHPTASRTTISYSEPPHKRHQKQNTRRNFFLAVVYENIHNLSPSDRG